MSQNSIHFTRPLPERIGSGYEVTMILTPVCDIFFKDVLEFHCEIEVLQGGRTPLSGGLIRYDFHLCDEKGKAFIEALHMVHFNLSGQLN